MARACVSAEVAHWRVPHGGPEFDEERQEEDESDGEEGNPMQDGLCCMRVLGTRKRELLHQTVCHGNLIRRQTKTRREHLGLHKGVRGDKIILFGEDQTPRLVRARAPRSTADQTHSSRAHRGLVGRRHMRVRHRATDAKT
eukprot:1266996-Rhodomonas_salina.1